MACSIIVATDSIGVLILQVIASSYFVQKRFEHMRLQSTETLLQNFVTLTVIGYANC